LNSNVVHSRFLPPHRPEYFQDGSRKYIKDSGNATLMNLILHPCRGRFPPLLSLSEFLVPVALILLLLRPPEPCFGFLALNAVANRLPHPGLPPIQAPNKSRRPSRISTSYRVIPATGLALPPVQRGSIFPSQHFHLQPSDPPTWNRIDHVEITVLAHTSPDYPQCLFTFLAVCGGPANLSFFKPNSPHSVLSSVAAVLCFIEA